MDLYESLKHLGKEEVEALQQAQQLEPLHALLLDTSKLSNAEFLTRFPLCKPHPFIPHAYYYKKETYEFGKDLIYDAGAISIQDAAAMLVPYFLNPDENDRVLDMCAAPGGKTIFASLLMGKKGWIVANDISYPRAKALSSNIERMGLGNTTVISSDLSIFDPHFLHSFSKIILDAPCSGSAMFRKDEEAEEDWSLDKVARCASIQAKLLENAYAYLLPGGRLIYSTCSFSYEENEGVLRSFLANHPDMHPVRVNEFDGAYHPNDLEEAIYLFPHRYDGEGQFFCLLEKEGALDLPNLPTPKKERFNDPLVIELLDRYELNDLILESRGDHIYGFRTPFNLKNVPVLRNGIDLFVKEGNHLMPSHHFARIIDSSLSIALNAAQAKAYLHGDSFPLDAQNGFQVVNYDGMNLGWVKVVNHIAKNHYPKGLRFAYDI